MDEKDFRQFTAKLREILSHGDGEVFFEDGSGMLGDESDCYHVMRKPSGEADWAVGEDGSVVVDWKEKFRRLEEGIYPPFRPGECVKVSGFVESEKGQYKIHVDFDGRSADNFYIRNTTVPNPFSDLPGMPVEVILTVDGERKEDWRLSDVWNYDASLKEIVYKPPVNPTEDEIAEIGDSQRVIIEGEFVSFEFDASSKNQYKSFTIHTTDSRDVTVFLNNAGSPIVFSGGIMENLYKKSPEPGDVIRVAPKVRNRRLTTFWCDPCYLICPSERREREYSALRESVKENIDAISRELDSADYQSARQLIGETRALELTDTETEEIRKLTETIPEDEQPVMCPKNKGNPSGKRHYYVRDIDSAYGVRLESMTKEEFADFAREAVTGQRMQTGKDADTSYIFLIAREFGIDAETRTDLAVNCIESRLKKIRGKPHSEIEFDDMYCVEQGLLHLAHAGTKRGAERLFDYIDYFIENRNYSPVGWRECDRSQLTPDFVNRAAYVLKTEIDLIPFNVLIRNLGRLEKTVSFLEANADDGYSLKYLKEVIGYITERDEDYLER